MAANTMKREPDMSAVLSNGKTQHQLWSSLDTPHAAPSPPQIQTEYGWASSRTITTFQKIQSAGERVK